MLRTYFSYDQEAVLDKDTYNAKKSTVFIVDLLSLNFMEKHDKTNNDFIVRRVKRHLSINNHMSKNVMKKYGLSFGSPKVTQLEDSVNYPVIVNLRSNKLKIIGLLNLLMNILTWLEFNMLSMMARTLINKTALSAL